MLLDLSCVFATLAGVFFSRVMNEISASAIVLGATRIFSSDLLRTEYVLCAHG